MSVIIQLLIGLLVSFLQGLLTKWFGPAPTPVTPPAQAVKRNTLPPSADAIAMQKDAYLAKIRWRIWLGPKRMEYGSKLYDKMVSRYSDSPRMVVSYENGMDADAANNFAVELTTGLTVE